MENVKKVTKKENFEIIAKLMEEMNRPELVEFARHEIELLEKKNANRSTSGKMAEVNKTIANLLIDKMKEINKPVTISELLQDEDIREYTYLDGKETKHITNQKITAIFKALTPDTIVKVADKKKVYFSLAN